MMKPAEMQTYNMIKQIREIEWVWQMNTAKMVSLIGENGLVLVSSKTNNFVIKDRIQRRRIVRSTFYPTNGNCVKIMRSGYVSELVSTNGRLKILIREKFNNLESMVSFVQNSYPNYIIMKPVESISDNVINTLTPHVITGRVE